MLTNMDEELAQDNYAGSDAGSAFLDCAVQIAQTLAALEGEQISQATKEELAGANRRVAEITKQAGE